MPSATSPTAVYSKPALRTRFIPSQSYCRGYNGYYNNGYYYNSRYDSPRHVCQHRRYYY